MPSVEICILAGGLGSRMGRDKTRVRLGGKTMLRRVRESAESSGWPVRIIRRDLVPRSGPLGGIYTGLKTTAADRVLFLACDMPFISVPIIENVATSFPLARAVCTREISDGPAGFPFRLDRDLLPVVDNQITARSFSLQTLAARCDAEFITTDSNGPELFNVNTPNDLATAKKFFHSPAAKLI